LKLGPDDWGPRLSAAEAAGPPLWGLCPREIGFPAPGRSRAARLPPCGQVRLLHRVAAIQKHRRQIGMGHAVSQRAAGLCRRDPVPGNSGPFVGRETCAVRVISIVSAEGARWVQRIL